MNNEYFSQFGEDKWIDDNLKLPEHGQFLDIGANDGVTGSNTLFLERRGWDGLCVDADPRSFVELLKNRKRASNLCVAYDNTITIPFVMSKDATLSHIMDNGDSYNPAEDQLIDVVTAGAEELCLSHNLDPFLVSIDVEGSEADVVRSFGHIVPPVIIVEYVTQGVDNFEKLRPVIGNYAIVHRTEANLIIVRSDMVNTLMK